MDDLISRRAAIELIKNDAFMVEYVWDADNESEYEALDDLVEKIILQMKESFIDRLKDMPSAQPLVLTCDGCRHVGTYDTDFPCSGCIRREKDYYEQER